MYELCVLPTKVLQKSYDIEVIISFNVSQNSCKQVRYLEKLRKPSDDEALMVSSEHFVCVCVCV